MRQFRVTVWSILVALAVFVWVLPERGQASEPTYEWAVARFQEPVQVLDKILMGHYLIEHDTDRMVQGGPCTAIYKYKDGEKGKLIVSFHCRPVERPATEVLKLRLQPLLATATGPRLRLVEYQFAGSTHGHRIPDAH